MVKSVFGDNLERLRKLQGMTRKQLANELKINETTLAGYENLGREPKYSLLVTIADYFGVSADDLIRESNVNSSNTKLNYYLKLAFFLGAKKFSSEKPEEIILSFPVTPLLENLPDNEGMLNPVKFITVGFPNGDTFCESFESWILQSVREKKTLSDTVSEYLYISFTEDFADK